MARVMTIIAARGGSEGIPGKNLKNFCGKPLLAWAIESSKGAHLVSKTVVTTDSEEIASVAKKYGAEAPFLRPSHLATSEIAIEPSLIHAVQYYEKEIEFKADYICLLQVTNPLRNSKMIDVCIQEAINGNFDCVMTVNEIPANHTPFWSLVERNNKPAFFYEKDLNSRFGRRQDFPEICYARNDLVYVFRPENLFMPKPNLYGDGANVKLVKTPSFYDGDINSKEDWILTENLFKFLQSEEGKKIEFQNT
ncbi:MAG: cytidylyltransferase domain-containing protein [Pseudobdellovibrionaceae bacterium]